MYICSIHNTLYIYKLQQYIIPLLLLSGQRTIYGGLLNKKSLGPFRPVRPAGLYFQARPGPLPFLVYTVVYTIQYKQWAEHEK